MWYISEFYTVQSFAYFEMYGEIDIELNENCNILTLTHFFLYYDWWEYAMNLSFHANISVSDRSL